MLILPFLFAGSLFSMQMQGNPDQSKPLYPQMFPRPSGNNAYEDYVQAVDMIRGSELYVLESWQPNAEPYEVDEPTGNSIADRSAIELVRMKNQIRAWNYLEVKREQARLFDQAWNAVVKGNQKPIQDPRPVMTVTTAFPELTKFKSLAKLGASEAYVEFSAGNTTGGTNTLLEGLSFAHKFGRAEMINTLVGIASTSIVLAEFQNHLGMLSHEDVVKIQPFVSNLLKDPPGMASAFQLEQKFSFELMAGILDAPDSRKALGQTYLDNDSLQSKLGVTLGSASKEQKMETRAKLEEFYSSTCRDLEILLNSPEKGWTDGVNQILASAPTDPLSRLCVEATSMAYDNALVAAAKERTQLRLLRLHAAIIQFRWENDRLPKDLAELKKSDFAHDPLNDKDFTYRLVPAGGYELFSEGHPSMGRIDLKYRRQPGFTPQGQDKLPPAALARSTKPESKQ